MHNISKKINKYNLRNKKIIRFWVMKWELSNHNNFLSLSLSFSHKHIHVMSSLVQNFKRICYLMCYNTIRIKKQFCELYQTFEKNNCLLSEKKKCLRITKKTKTFLNREIIKRTKNHINILNDSNPVQCAGFSAIFIVWNHKHKTISFWISGKQI